MPVKFKLAFTIDGETLFGVLAKFLPIQDLVVEEVPDRKADLADIARAFHRPPRAKPIRKAKGGGYVLNPHAGVNAIILDFLRDGMPHAMSDVVRLVKDKGYSPNGTWNRIERLHRYEYIERIAKGQYQLAAKGLALYGVPTQEGAA